MNIEKPPLLWHESDLFRLLTTPQGLTRLKQIMKENEILTTFANGYGVIIIPILLEEGNEIFDMTVLRLHGAEILKHRVAQYLPIPELNRSNFSETIDLCLKVACLPQEAGTTRKSKEFGTLDCSMVTCGG